MTRIHRFLGMVPVVVATLLSAAASGAASLQQVQNWGASGVPADVSMSIYVPDAVADNPPILVLVHYCGGTAQAVFGQAQGGGIVAAADEYGFIIVVPSSGRCWDVRSDQTWTREGGGDSHAIRQMVTYAIEMRGGNADRVYVTGDSSGGMMTELLLALYPDVFKAGSALAGMPAGCRGDNESPNDRDYSGACAGGSVMRTPEEWGEIVRMMHPGYTGHRPRVQLFHGDADTIIRYPNHTEAIKQWTNVLELSEDPTSEEQVELGEHQATRQRWQNACGVVVLDAFTSLGGDHGPSDALFPADYVIPFLGLDQTGPVDPEIELCDDNGAGGTGGSAGMSGGNAGSAPMGGAAGAAVAGASGSSAGGVAGTAGAAGSAGIAGTSGLGGGGGSAGTGASGGSPAAGAAGAQNLSGAGGVAGASGSNASGGGLMSGGSGGMPAGTGGGEAAPASEGGCHLATRPSSRPSSFFFLVLGVAFAHFTRRTRRPRRPRRA